MAKGTVPGSWADSRGAGYNGGVSRTSKEVVVIDLTGKPAAPFELRDSKGRIHRLETYRGRWLLMVFHRHLG